MIRKQRKLALDDRVLKATLRLQGDIIKIELISNKWLLYALVDKFDASANESIKNSDFIDEQTQENDYYDAYIEELGKLEELLNDRQSTLSILANYESQMSTLGDLWMDKDSTQLILAKLTWLSGLTKREVKYLKASMRYAHKRVSDFESLLLDTIFKHDGFSFRHELFCIFRRNANTIEAGTQIDP